MDGGGGGGTGPDYYSLYNCGWGIRAVLAYEAATKDMSHHMFLRHARIGRT